MDNHHDAQVAAFITAINRCGGNGYADVQYAGNGEFIIDGVVNVRAALDAALSTGVDTVKFRGMIVVVHPEFPPHYWDGESMRRIEPRPEHHTHHEPGEFGEGATVRVIGCDMCDGSATISKGSGE